MWSKPKSRLWRAVFHCDSHTSTSSTKHQLLQPAPARSVVQYCCWTSNLSLSQLPCFKPERRLRRRGTGGAPAVTTELLRSRWRPAACLKGGAGGGRGAFRLPLLRPWTDQVCENVTLLSVLCFCTVTSAAASQSGCWDNGPRRSPVMGEMPGLDLIQFPPDPSVFPRKCCFFWRPMSFSSGIYSWYRRYSCFVGIKRIGTLLVPFAHRRWLDYATVDLLLIYVDLNARHPFVQWKSRRVC
jgi:hypothetical protein